VTTVRATINNVNSMFTDISYSFVYDGIFVDRVDEFQFLNSSSGQIYLVASLNRSAGSVREVSSNVTSISNSIYCVFYLKNIHPVNFKLTLAATVRRISDQYVLTTYQYLCIIILASDSYQPCFRAGPVKLIFMSKSSNSFN
jgi:hypothetical protein